MFLQTKTTRGKTVRPRGELGQNHGEQSQRTMHCGDNVDFSYYYMTSPISKSLLDQIVVPFSSCNLTSQQIYGQHFSTYIFKEHLVQRNVSRC